MMALVLRLEPMWSRTTSHRFVEPAGYLRSVLARRPSSSSVHGAASSCDWVCFAGALESMAAASSGAASLASFSSSLKNRLNSSLPLAFTDCVSIFSDASGVCLSTNLSSASSGFLMLPLAFFRAPRSTSPSAILALRTISAFSFALRASISALLGLEGRVASKRFLPLAFLAAFRASSSSFLNWIMRGSKVWARVARSIIRCRSALRAFFCAVWFCRFIHRFSSRESAFSISWSVNSSRWPKVRHESNLIHAS
mmetsp:Transcript_4943/g.15971  ORF Transcript_4943/g.15971 Transcript_4943/m.15971 type:complete len:254 (-) Transcript_4943:6-767(-)